MRKCLYLLLFLLSQSILATPNEDIKKIIKLQQFHDQNLGLVIAKDGNKIFELNSNSLMIPASLTKIITAGAILNKLPLNTKLTTEIWSSASIDGEKLKGSICLKGGGDPSFVSEKMWFLVNEFTRSGIKKIDGDIIVDSSRFDDELFDKGRESVRVDRAFDAPISAVSFNWNSVNVFIRPSLKPHEPAHVFIDPDNDYIEVDNRAKTGQESSKLSIEVSRETINQHDKIIITGTIPLNHQEIVFYKSISNPSAWIGSHFKSFLKQRNIDLSGKVINGQCEKGSKKLASVDSKNLNEMLSDMLKFSNNFVAEMLIKNLAAINHVDQPAKMIDGINEIKNYLESIGLKKSEYTLENVSGLTRGNKFSANQLLNVLYEIRNDFQVFPEFLSGLPIAGIDGTLKKRFKSNTDLYVRAKTGYLDGVVGLAGFVGRKNKQPLVFVFMFNGSYEKALEARKLFDSIIEQAKKWD